MEVVKVAQDAKSRKSAHANAKRALMETYLKRRKERRWTIKRTGETREKEEEGKGKIKGERYRGKTKGDNNERLREKGGAEGRRLTGKDDGDRANERECVKEMTGTAISSSLLWMNFSSLHNFFHILIFSNISVIFLQINVFNYFMTILIIQTKEEILYPILYSKCTKSLFQIFQINEICSQ